MLLQCYSGNSQPIVPRDAFCGFIKVFNLSVAQCLQYCNFKVYIKQFSGCMETCLSSSVFTLVNFSAFIMVVTAYNLAVSMFLNLIIIVIL